MLDNRKEVYYLTLALDSNRINTHTFIEYVVMLTNITERNLLLSQKLKTQIRSRYRDIIKSYKPVLLNEIDKGLALYDYKKISILTPLDVSNFGVFKSLFQ